MIFLQRISFLLDPKTSRWINYSGYIAHLMLVWIGALFVSDIIYFVQEMSKIFFNSKFRFDLYSFVAFKKPEAFIIPIL